MIRAGSVGRRDTSERIEYDDDDNELDVFGDAQWDEKGRTLISHIYVSFGKVITSIQFGYLENGAIVLSEKYGPSEGFSFRVVTLNQDEYVTGLSGTLGYNGGIRNLTFHTNRGEHGPIGYDDKVKDACLPKIEIVPAIRDRREFGGFFGSYRTECVTSIGIYVNPIPSSHIVV